MTFTIFFATSTGKTEDVADRLKELLPGAEAKDVDNLGSSDELVAADALVCCVPTWNTGADEARSGTAWDDLAQEIPNLDAASRHGTREPTKQGLERHGMILLKKFQILILLANLSRFLG